MIKNSDLYTQFVLQVCVHEQNYRFQAFAVSGGRDPCLGHHSKRGRDIAVAMDRSGGRDPSAAAFWSREIAIAMDNKSQQSCRSCRGGLGKNLRVHETYAGKMLMWTFSNMPLSYNLARLLGRKRFSKGKLF
jgi:hypothetical protein